jgi:hypothetical protein
MDAEAERDRIAADLLEAETCLARDRTIWRAEMLDMRQDAIQRLISRLEAAEAQVARAHEAEVGTRRATVRSGLPTVFLKGDASLGDRQ